MFALSEALKVWQSLTGAVQGFFNVSVSAGQTWVPVPRQLLTVYRVKPVGQTQALDQWSTAELDASKGDWEAVTPATPRFWAPEGATLLALYPRPAVDTNLVLQGPLDIPYLSRGINIAVGDEEFTRILAYAQSPYLSFKEAPSEMATASLGLLVEAAGNRNQRLRNTDIYRRFAGSDRVIADNQSGEPRLGEASVGAR